MESTPTETAISRIVDQLRLTEPNLDHIHQWNRFRDALLVDKVLDHMRTDKNFKDAVQLVTNIHEILVEIKTGLNGGRINHLSDHLAEMLFEQEKAVEVLINVLELIEPNPWDLSGNNITAMNRDLKYIQKWQIKRNESKAK